MVRMNARGGEQHARVRVRKIDGFTRGLDARSRHYQLRHAGIRRALEYRAAVGIETVVGEVCPDVDELHQSSRIQRRRRQNSRMPHSANSNDAACGSRAVALADMGLK